MRAAELRLEPDSLQTEIGQIIWLSGMIGPSDSMRAFTVYLNYDTNYLALQGAPVPGALLVGRAGLDFRFLDHVPSEPDWLEIGGTVFSEDFWAGPGELFRVPLIARRCGDVTIHAPFGIAFRDLNDVFQSGAVRDSEVLICYRVPRPARGLTAYPMGENSIMLRWESVSLDTLSRTLLSPARYSIFRQQLLPVTQIAESLTTIGDTVFVTGTSSGTMYVYWIRVSSAP